MKYGAKAFDQLQQVAFFSNCDETDLSFLPPFIAMLDLIPKLPYGCLKKFVLPPCP
jgi:hypothetical protein